MIDHLLCGLPMMTRIDLVEPVSKLTDRLQTLFQSSPMTIHINTVSQSAHYQSIRANLFQVANKRAAEVLPIVCNLSCAYHTDNVLRVEIGRTAIVEQDRSVVAVLESLRIVLVVQAQTANFALSAELKFLFGSLQIIAKSPIPSRNLGEADGRTCLRSLRFS